MPPVVIMAIVCTVGALVFAGIVLYLDKDTDRSLSFDLPPEYDAGIMNKEATHPDGRYNSVSVEDINVTTIRNYKTLLDEGAITQEEFNEKEKQLLGLR